MSVGIPQENVKHDQKTQIKKLFENTWCSQVIVTCHLQARKSSQTSMPVPWTLDDGVMVISVDRPQEMPIHVAILNGSSEALS